MLIEARDKETRYPVPIPNLSCGDALGPFCVVGNKVANFPDGLSAITPITRIEKETCEVVRTNIARQQSFCSRAKSLAYHGTPHEQA